MQPTGFSPQSCGGHYDRWKHRKKFDQISYFLREINGQRPCTTTHIYKQAGVMIKKYYSYLGKSWKTTRKAENTVQFSFDIKCLYFKFLFWAIVLNFLVSIYAVFSRFGTQWKTMNFPGKLYLFL